MARLGMAWSGLAGDLPVAPLRLAVVNDGGEIIGHGFLEVEVVGDVDALGRATTDVRFVIENGQAR